VLSTAEGPRPFQPRNPRPPHPRQATPPTVPRFQQTENFERGEGGAEDDYGGRKQHVEERLTLTLAHDRSAEKTDEVGGRGTRQDAQQRPPPCCPSVPRCFWSIQWRRLLVQLPPDQSTLRNQKPKSGQKRHEGEDKQLSDTTKKKEWAHPLNKGNLRRTDRCQRARRDKYVPVRHLGCSPDGALSKRGRRWGGIVACRGGCRTSRRHA